MEALRQPFGGFGVVVGVHQDQLRRRRGQARDEFAEITRRRRHARLRLDRGQLLHAEPAHEIGLVPVHDHDRHALERRGLRFPAGHGLGPALREVGTARRVGVGARRIDGRQFRRERLRDGGDVARIELDVGVAERVDVAHRAVELGWHFRERDRRGRLEEPGAAALDAGVGGFLQQHRQPARLELGTVRDQEVRRARTRDEARLRLDAVHVLQRARRDIDIDPVAAKFLRERAPVGGGREDADRRLRR
jgi:hypothetical protein